jgi:hypothetical protein
MNGLMTWMQSQATAPELVGVAALWTSLAARLDEARGDERGLTMEQVIITAGLSALAVAAVAIIGNRVNKWARKIQ